MKDSILSLQREKKVEFGEWDLFNYWDPTFQTTFSTAKKNKKNKKKM